MEIKKFYREVISGDDNELANYTGPIIKDINEAIEVAYNSFSNLDLDKNTLLNRKRIASVSEVFHKKADTLTKEVKASIDLMKSGDNVLVIETAHQPNLFPYSGMLMKPVLSHLIAEGLRERDIPVVEIFGLLDRNDLKAGWTRRTYLPDLDSKEGILTVRKEIKSKKLIFNATPKPDLREITCWKDSLVDWVKRNRKAINKIYREESSKELIGGDEERFFFKQIREMFELWEELIERSDSYGSFNCFFLSDVVNKRWGYPTVFIPYSESIGIFENEIKALLGNSETYVQSHNKHRENVKKHVGIDFAEVSLDDIPFWHVCDCGSKIRLSGEGGILKGECTECDCKISLEINALHEFVSRLSPQAISRHLIFFEGLKPSLYVSGWGAMPFTLVAKGIANDLGMYFPPIIPFKINEHFHGIGKLRSNLELKKRELSRTEIDSKIEELKVLSEELRANKRIDEFKKTRKDLRDLIAIRNSLNCAPSILDYWINQGINETKNGWEDYIKKKNFGEEWIHLPPWINNENFG